MRSKVGAGGGVVSFCYTVWLLALTSDSPPHLPPIPSRSLLSVSKVHPRPSDAITHCFGIVNCCRIFLLSLSAAVAILAGLRQRSL